MAIEVQYCATYAPDSDITFIVEDTMVNNECIQTQVVGFYYGKPDEELTKKYYGRTRVEYKF